MLSIHIAIKSIQQILRPYVLAMIVVLILIRTVKLPGLLSKRGRAQPHLSIMWKQPRRAKCCLYASPYTDFTILSSQWLAKSHWGVNCRRCSEWLTDRLQSYVSFLRFFIKQRLISVRINGCALGVDGTCVYFAWRFDAYLSASCWRSITLGSLSCWITLALDSSLSKKLVKVTIWYAFAKNSSFVPSMVCFDGIILIFDHAYGSQIPWRRSLVIIPIISFVDTTLHVIHGYHKTSFSLLSAAWNRSFTYAAICSIVHTLISFFIPISTCLLLIDETFKKLFQIRFVLAILKIL